MHKKEASYCSMEAKTQDEKALLLKHAYVCVY